MQQGGSEEAGANLLMPSHCFPEKTSLSPFIAILPVVMRLLLLHSRDRRNAQSLYRESPQDASSSTSPALDAPILAESASTPAATAILQHLVVLLQLPGS